MAQNGNTLQQAVQLLQGGKFADALGVLDTLLESEPDNRAALINAGICHLQIKQYEAATERLRRAAFLDNGDAENWALLGFALLSHGRHRDAVRPLRRALEIVPESIQYLEMLADALAGSGDSQGAVSTYETLLRRQPENLLWPGRLGLLAAQHGDRQRAIDLLQRAVGPTKDEFEFRATLGELLMATEAFVDIKIHFDVCVTLMKQRLAAGDYDTALAMENAISRAFIRRVTSEEHGAACYAEWSAEMAAAGRKAASDNPVTPAKAADVPVVGFFLHRGSTLAHVSAVLSAIEGMGPPENRPIRPRFYVLHDTDASLLEACRKLDMPLTVIDEQWPNGKVLDAPFQRLLWLRQRLAEDDVETIVWITSPTYQSFAAALQMAPIQIFWAMRYHHIHPPEIDGFLTLGPLFRDRLTFHGHEWRAHPLIVGGLLEGIDDTEAAALRSRLAQYDTILGTFARTEKLADPLFLEGVCLTLKANPGAFFLWSGQSEDPDITAYFESAAVADRCRYLGWIDTALHATAIDIFMDTAPAGCGVTAMEAMAAGKAIVAFDAAWTMWGENITPILNGEIDNQAARQDMEAIFAMESDRPLLSRADSPEAYATFATSVINDKAYRRAVGEAGRVFCERYLGNLELSASIVSGHLVEIIDDARAGKSSC